MDKENIASSYLGFRDVYKRITDSHTERVMIREECLHRLLTIDSSPHRELKCFVSYEQNILFLVKKIFFWISALRSFLEII